jgi:hypothetical protein
MFLRLLSCVFSNISCLMLEKAKDLCRTILSSSLDAATSLRNLSQLDSYYKQSGTEKSSHLEEVRSSKEGQQLVLTCVRIVSKLIKVTYCHSQFRPPFTLAQHRLMYCTRVQALYLPQSQEASE